MATRIDNLKAYAGGTIDYMIGSQSFTLTTRSTNTRCDAEGIGKDMGDFPVGFDTDMVGEYSSFASALTDVSISGTTEQQITELTNRLESATSVLGIIGTSKSYWEGQYSTCEGKGAFYSCKDCQNQGFKEKDLKTLRDNAKSSYATMLVAVNNLNLQLESLRNQAEQDLNLETSVSLANRVIANTNKTIAEADMSLYEAQMIETKTKLYQYGLPLLLIGIGLGLFFYFRKK